MITNWRKCPECGLTQGAHTPDCPNDPREWLNKRVDAEIGHFTQAAEAPLDRAVKAVQDAVTLGTGIWQIHYEPREPQQADTRAPDPTPPTTTAFMDQLARRRDAMKPLNPEAVAPERQDVTNPNHYRQHPSGVECIAITEHMGFNLGNAVKYIWRADLKHETPLDDLKKARWYLEREIARLGG